MHVNIRRTGAIALLAASSAILPAACARNDSSIFIRSCLATTDRTGCMFQIQLTSAEIFGGSIDAAYNGEYHCIAVVENQMDARADPNRLKTETDGVELYEAEVQVLDPAQGNAAIKQFSVPITGWIDVGQSGQPGFGGTDITMVDAATIQAEAAKVVSTKKVQTVVASVIAKGRTLGGFEVHSQEFLFPIDISYGSSCYQPVGMPCCGGTGSSSTVDCRLAIDESTNCQSICAYLGACKTLECNKDALGNPDLSSAHCPTHTPPDASCCPP